MQHHKYRAGVIFCGLHDDELPFTKERTKFMDTFATYLLLNRMKGQVNFMSDFAYLSSFDWTML